jgi:acrylyl-CoA reductase (NADPH)
MADEFKAFRIHCDDAGYRSGVESLTLDDLSPGEVVIHAEYSSVNYKDALAAGGKGKILRQFPLNGGIDVAGVVTATTDKRFREGDAVLCTGCGLSETRDGGYAEYARLQADWTMPLPDGLTTREAMGLGTAGFTVALALWRMETNGQTPDMGPIAITGATGGVGTLAVDIYARAGYEVHAISGKTDRFSDLKKLGAAECLDRNQLDFGTRPLESARFGGALDNAGGEMLAGLTRVTRPWGNIASIGLVAGIELNTTVMPFIIRGISLLGINSAGCPLDLREKLWGRLATDWKPAHMEKIITKEVTLDQLPDVFDTLLAGEAFGRTVVKL